MWRRWVWGIEEVEKRILREGGGKEAVCVRECVPDTLETP